ncbi:hypothetical protein LCGC14_1519900 [marine sediment metagenome]|uniref:Uncharacterized protein n=1 Tax=marine sediment metagenome TaxID=412755 RepID=A0A0F9JJU0_9ZZZZ
METYTDMKKRHGEEIDSFEGLFFAFSNKQLDEGLEKMKATTKDIVSIGVGGFILKTEVVAWENLFNMHDKERKERLKDEKKLVDALVYELNNHEYGYTYDPSSALEALGLTVESVEPKLLKKACKLVLT